MSVDNLTLNEGGTFNAPTGGSNITFNPTGETVANGVVSHNDSDADFYTREKLYAVSRQPTVGSDGEYTKMKNSLRIVRPSTLASGKVVYNLIRIEVEVHPEDGASEVTNLISLGTSALNSSDAEDFFQYGSLR
jgi:hypothetical protein